MQGVGLRDHETELLEAVYARGWCRVGVAVEGTRFGAVSDNGGSWDNAEWTGGVSDALEHPGPLMRLAQKGARGCMGQL